VRQILYHEMCGSVRVRLGRWMYASDRVACRRIVYGCGSVLA
jgi:hypothetical protein